MKLWSTHQLLSKAIKLPGEVQPGCIGINSTILPPTKVPQDCLIHLHRPWISIYLWFINFHSTLFRFLPGYAAAKEEGIAFIMISLFMVCSGVSASQDYWYNTPLDLPCSHLFPHTRATADIYAVANEEMRRTCCI